MKTRLFVAGAVLLILVIVAGYWLGTEEMTGEIQEEGEAKDEDIAEQ